MLWIILSVIIIIFLVFASAFFSGAEMAFVSINRAVVRDKAREGDKHAKVLDRLLQKPNNVISAIVIGNNFSNILASILAGTVTTIIFGNIGIGIATVVMMFVVIIFCEIAPKSFGLQNMRFARSRGDYFKRINSDSWWEKTRKVFSHRKRDNGDDETG